MSGDCKCRSLPAGRSQQCFPKLDGDGRMGEKQRNKLPPTVLAGLCMWRPSVVTTDDDHDLTSLAVEPGPVFALTDTRWYSAFSVHSAVHTTCSLRQWDVKTVFLTQPVTVL